MKVNFTGNKGEWGEVYAIFKIIGDKTLYAGDIDHNRIEDIFFPVIGVLKQEASSKEIYFSLEDEIVFISCNNEEITRIAVNVFAEKAVLLLSKIKEGSGSFEVKEIEEFLSSLKFTSIKYSKRGKADIFVKIHDFRINQKPMLGFSIKSEFGSLPTLFNASKSSNLVYEVKNIFLKQKDIEYINNIKGNAKYKKRVKGIYDLGGKLELYNIENSIFNNNLIIVDSLMPKILSELIIQYYLSPKSKLYELVKIVNKQNPLNFNFRNIKTNKNDYNQHPYYENNIKKAISSLCAIFDL